jgi:hypothetical protein
MDEVLIDTTILVFTEDFTNGRRVEGVQFLNPLLPAFDLTMVVSERRSDSPVRPVLARP